MNRREFLKSIAAVGASVSLPLDALGQRPGKRHRPGLERGPVQPDDLLCQFLGNPQLRRGGNLAADPPAAVRMGPGA